MKKNVEDIDSDDNIFSDDTDVDPDYESIVQDRSENQKFIGCDSEDKITHQQNIQISSNTLSTIRFNGNIYVWLTFFHSQKYWVFYLKRMTPVSYTHLDVYKRQVLRVFEEICIFC